MIIAVFCVVIAGISMLNKFVKAIQTKYGSYTLYIEIILVTIGISYLIWYCN